MFIALLFESVSIFIFYFSENVWWKVIRRVMFNLSSIFKAHAILRSVSSTASAAKASTALAATLLVSVELSPSTATVLISFLNVASASLLSVHRGGMFLMDLCPESVQSLITRVCHRDFS